jgi:hypothetical protein
MKKRKQEPNKHLGSGLLGHTEVCYQVPITIHLTPEDGGIVFLQNGGIQS